MLLQRYFRPTNLRSYKKGTVSTKSNTVKFSLRWSSTNSIDLTKSYNIKLNKCVKMQEYEEGILLYQEMKKKNVQPDTLTYKLVFDLYDVGVDPEGAQSFMEELSSQGIKTELNEINERISHLAERVETRRKAASLFNDYVSKKKAGLNLFDPPA